MMEILTHQTTWKVSVMFFHSEWHNYITAITKLDAVWFCHSRGGRLFGGESSLKSRSGGLTITGWHSVSWSFLLVTDPFLGGGQKCDEELVGQAGGQTLLHVQLQYFFPRISCQRQLQLLQYCCLVKQCCFVGHFSLFCWVKDLCSYQTVRPTRPRCVQ